MENGTEGKYASITPLSFQEIIRRFNESLAEKFLLVGDARLVFTAT
jgi:hypothetical protein